MWDSVVTLMREPFLPVKWGGNLARVDLRCWGWAGVGVSGYWREKRKWARALEDIYMLLLLLLKREETAYYAGWRAWPS